MPCSDAEVGCSHGRTAQGIWLDVGLKAEEWVAPCSSCRDLP